MVGYVGIYILNCGRWLLNSELHCNSDFLPAQPQKYSTAPVLLESGLGN